MSVQILSRSRWTSTSASGTPFTWSRVRGIVCHYPAAGADMGVLTEAQECAQIRRWRNYHVRSLGWVDLGYNYVITQAGRIYRGRGDRVGAHAVGHNSRTVGVLFMVGDNEPLTAAAKRAFRALRNTLRRRGCGAGLWGHREMSGNSTRCPGPYIMRDIRDGSLKGGTGGTAGTTPALEPWKASPRIAGMSRDEVKGIQRHLDALGYDLGSYGVDGSYGRDTWEAVRAFQRKAGVSVDGVAGPETVAALKAAQPKVPAGGEPAPAKPAPRPSAPAFPLPRRSGGMFYYGPPSGPKTSVSGRGRNSAVPGDVVRVGGRWKSRGLETFQRRLKERGYSLTVDGRYGDETARIVRYFQRLVGLKDDGKIGPATWAAAWTEPVR